MDYFYYDGAGGRRLAAAVTVPDVGCPTSTLGEWSDISTDWPAPGDSRRFRHDETGYEANANPGDHFVWHVSEHLWAVADPVVFGENYLAETPQQAAERYLDHERWAGYFSDSSTWSCGCRGQFPTDGGFNVRTQANGIAGLLPHPVTLQEAVDLANLPHLNGY